MLYELSMISNKDIINFVLCFNGKSDMSIENRGIKIKKIISNFINIAKVSTN